MSANGVRFTRTPEAIMRRRSLLAGVAKGGMESDPQAHTDNVATALLSIVEPEAVAQAAAPDPQTAPLPAGLSRPSRLSELLPEALLRNPKGRASQAAGANGKAQAAGAAGRAQAGLKETHRQEAGRQEAQSAAASFGTNGGPFQISWQHNQFWSEQIQVSGSVRPVATVPQVEASSRPAPMAAAAPIADWTQSDMDDVDLGYLALYHSEIIAPLPPKPPVAASPARPPAPASLRKADAPLETSLAATSRVVFASAPVPAPSRALVRPIPVTDGEGYKLPSLEFLAEPPEPQGPTLTEDILEETAGRLEKVIRDFGVKGEVIHVHPGPVVTLYEFEPAPGIKSSRVIALSDDIARSMSAVSARVAVIPGRNAIGIELPNETRETVYLRELLASEDFEDSKHKLPLCLGKTIGGEPVIADLARMPHLLVAGTTGSGKSVAINTMILSLLYRFTPDECRLIMVDPEDAGTVGLRRHPASAHPGRDRPEEGDHRLALGGARDGGALQEDVEARGPQHRRLQRPRGGGQGAGRGHHPHGADGLRPGDRGG